MNELINFSLPLVILLAMAVFFWRQRQQNFVFRDRMHHMRMIDEYEDEDEDDSIEKLVTTKDIELRVLEEVTKEGSRQYFYESHRRPSREIKLEKIQKKLRKTLTNAISADNFDEIKERVIKLLDESVSELNAIQQKIPFEGLDDPERSLLIDILEEIDSTKEIPRQKTEQLAVIIKIKNRDIEKLQLQNSTSVSWTRWGTVGTVSFGILSLVLSIYTIYT
ncbi:hypothetical protein SPONL_1170 [uncultured Candidatus Thioglobus sp.]|nr:hypothetical protein SPONL_1170 [uncultured Candidatus Thioglobus sp.]